MCVSQKPHMPCFNILRLEPQATLSDIFLREKIWVLIYPVMFSQDASGVAGVLLNVPRNGYLWLSFCYINRFSSPHHSHVPWHSNCVKKQCPFISKACSSKCWVFVGCVQSLELCPSTKEALKWESRCHGVFQASSPRVNQIIVTLAASVQKELNRRLGSSHCPSHTTEVMLRGYETTRGGRGTQGDRKETTHWDNFFWHCLPIQPCLLATEDGSLSWCFLANWG